MIVVDSSVWVDYLRDQPTRQVEELDRLLDRDEAAIGDLILTEVLQGLKSERAFNQTLELLTRLDIVDIGGEQVAVESARNYRLLRARGLTVRKTIDCLIATRCIIDGHSLLYSDRDFDPFVEQLGLISAMADRQNH